VDPRGILVALILSILFWAAAAWLILWLPAMLSAR
jgi:hypothetical protein